MITFAQPIWILFGTLACSVLIGYFYQNRKKRRERLGQFSAHNLIDNLTRNVSQTKRRLKSTLFVLALFCCFLAIARPQYGFQWIDVKRKGIDILFALDTSKSMLAEDTKPNRLERAKFGILDFVRQLDGDRIGLLPFAGSAFLMCPLTMDYNAFEHSLSSVDTAIIPKGGTDLSGAINNAQAVLGNQANHKILILITDGENLEGDVVKTARKAHEQGMTIFTVGVGTSEGELIPGPDPSGPKYIKDREGKFITSKLDEKTLKQIAELGGGIYAPLGSRSQGFETIYQEKLSLIPKEELAEKRTKVPIERSEWPILVAFLLLAIEFLLSGRKTAPISFPFIPSINRKKRKTVVKHLIIGCFSIPLLFPVTGHCSPGEDAFNNGDYIGASEYYQERLEKEDNNPQLHFNYGTAAYKNNLLDDAIAAFNKALKTDDLTLQAKAYYNRGNAFYKKGTETLQSDLEHTIKTWQSAIDSYNNSLNLVENDENSRFNRDLVAKKLDELKKQQQQQDQQTENKEEKESQSEQQQDKEGSSPQDSKQGSKQQQEKEGDNQKEEDTPQGVDNKNNDKAKTDEQQQSIAQTTENKEKAQEVGEGTNQEPQKADSQAQGAADQQRRLLGKMTQEEAKRLLDGLKNEESELNFVPSQKMGHDSEPRRDW